jgi:hypothetical protein
MFVMTGLYLALEVPFSVHLAAVLGGAPTADDIHHIERFGRTLSGIAAAIAVIGMWHFPRMERLGVSRVRAIVTALVIGSIAGSATYASLNAYADFRAFASSGQERKDAVVAALAKRAILETGIIEGLGLDEHQRNAFLAVMPEMMGAKAMLGVSGRTPLQLASYAGDDAKQALGSVSDFKQDFFKTHFAAARDGYARYHSALADVKAAFADQDASAEDDWQSYKARMDKEFPRGWPVGRGWYRASVWREVHGRGIPVPENWDIHDKETFIAAVKSKSQDEIAETYVKAVEAELGKGVRLSPGLSFEQFLAVPAVQKKIRDEMNGLSIAGNDVLSPAMSTVSFESALYNPQVERAVAEMRRTLAAQPDDFEAGAFAKQGKDAVKGRILPALAIVLSMTGAIVHIFKFTGYGIQIAAHLSRIRFFQIGLIRHAMAVSLMVMGGSQILGISSSQISSPAMDRIGNGSAYSTVLSGAVMMQPQLAEVSGQLSRIGIWEIVGANLPKPRLVSHAVAPTEERVALLSPADVPLSATRPVN